MIIHFIRGYLKLKYSGEEQIRFINLCKNNRLEIWDVSRKENEIHMCSTVSDFYRMKHIAKKCNGRPVITEKHGLPFLIHRYYCRGFFFVGLVIYLMLIALMSHFVWSISFDGNYSYSDYELMDFLRSRHITCGKAISDYSCDDIEFLIREHYADITWVSAEKYGTQLIIHIQENYDRKISAIEERPYHIVSNVDGVIQSCITRSGICQIKQGDSVEKGQILVSGQIDYFDDAKNVTQTKLVNSDADIYAYVILPYSEKFPLKYKKKLYSGRENRAVEFSILGKRLHATGFYKKFKAFDTIQDYKELRITKNFHLPVEIVTSKYCEYHTQEAIYSKEEAKTLAQSHIANFINNLQEKGIQIIENNVTIDTDQKECKVSGNFMVLEKIGQIQYIEGEEETK